MKKIYYFYYQILFLLLGSLYLLSSLHAKAIIEENMNTVEILQMGGMGLLVFAVFLSLYNEKKGDKK